MMLLIQNIHHGLQKRPNDVTRFAGQRHEMIRDSISATFLSAVPA